MSETRLERTTRQRRNRSPLSRRVNQISPSGIRKFFDLLSSLEGVISLGVGEPDFVTPWNIREAGIYSLEKGQTMYTSNKGLLQLRQEIARYLEARYGLVYDPEKELLITVGVSQGLDLALRSVIDPGDEVLMPDPAYVAYSPCTTLAEGVPVPVPTGCEGEFKLRAIDVEARISPRTKALLIGYPANPTGAVMSREDLLPLATLARKHDFLVVSDEIYARLVYGMEHTCFASLPGMKERTILLGGFSKAYAMTGWRIGYAASTPEIIEAMTKVHQYAMLCVPTTAQFAALEAVRAGDDAVEEMVAEYDRRRRFIVKGLEDIGLSCFEPRGAFYAFPQVKITGMTSEDFAEKLLMEEKVAVVPGSAFGEYGKGHVRCCYATSMEDIEEALLRMGRFVQRHRPV